MSAPFAAPDLRLNRGRTGAIWSGALLVAFLSLHCSSDTPASPPGALAGANAIAGAGAGAGGAGFAAGGDSASGGLPAGGNAGAGGAIAMWTTNGSKYSLNLGSTYLELDAANGARMTALRVGGSTGPNLLADSATTGQADNWGSTFWPSPQADWAWPPTESDSINAINTLPYTAVSDALTLTLTSQLNVAPPTVSVIKKFSVDLAKEAIIIDYTMTNGGTAPVSVAPWEVTRVAAGGITFYGDAGDAAVVVPATTLMDGVRWYHHDPSAVTQPDKFLSDGKGWLAHAAGDLLLIKSFPDIAPAQSPKGEAEIEIYSDPKYVEVENQGALQTLAPAEALHWTVRWYARKLATPAVVGSADLVLYVQNQIK